MDDLLDVSRIQSGNLTVYSESLSLREVIVSVVAVLQSTTDKHRFVVLCPENTLQVTADRDKLEQVLTNLLTNAIKYSPDGGNITVNAELDRERGRVVTSVADQGLGISPANSADLFATFHRIRRPETEGIRGSGLGLYIVSQLVKLMDGEVWLESELGEGSTFFFSLPEYPDQKPGQSELRLGGQFG